MILGDIEGERRRNHELREVDSELTEHCGPGAGRLRSGQRRETGLKGSLSVYVGAVAGVHTAIAVQRDAGGHPVVNLPHVAAIGNKEQLVGAGRADRLTASEACAIECAFTRGAEESQSDVEPIAHVGHAGRIGRACEGVLWIGHGRTRHAGGLGTIADLEVSVCRQAGKGDGHSRRYKHDSNAALQRRAFPIANSRD